MGKLLSITIDPWILRIQNILIPLVIAGFLLGVGYAAPRFQEMFQEMGLSLPPLTRHVLWIGNHAIWFSPLPLLAYAANRRLQSRVSRNAYDWYTVLGSLILFFGGMFTCSVAFFLPLNGTIDGLE